MRNTRRFLAMILAVVMALACVSVAAADAQPDSWIADRTIVVQAYVDDIGYNLPDDLNATPVMQKITRADWHKARDPLHPPATAMPP